MLPIGKERSGDAEVVALDPNDLRDLFQRALDEYWDEDAYDEVVEQEDDERARLLELRNRL